MPAAAFIPRSDQLAVVVESPASPERMKDMFPAVDGLLRKELSVGGYNKQFDV